MKYSVQQYVLVGAGLGLYFGYFFRPLREPSIERILFLTIVITIVMTLIRLWRGERERLLQQAAGTFIRYALVLAVLEGRHIAFDYGGRIAVVAMTTVAGALFGLYLSRSEEATS